MPPETKKRVRHRKVVMVELSAAERAKLERLRDARGERATLAGVMRELLARANDPDRRQLPYVGPVDGEAE